MTKKINVVNLNMPDQRNEELELTKIKEEIQKEDQIMDSPAEDKGDVIESKAKPKARTKRKPDIQVVENIIEVKQEEAKQEDVKQEEVKQIDTKEKKEYINCPKCKKKMLKKSFRYNHEQNCQGVVRDELPVKRRSKHIETKPDIKTEINIPEEIIEKEVKKKYKNKKN